MNSAFASRHSFVSSAAILTASQYAAAAVGLVTTLLAARLLGPEAFGIAAVVMAYPALVSSLGGVKTSVVTQRYVSGFRATHQHSELLAVCRLGFAIDFAASVFATVIVVVLVLFVGSPPGTHDRGGLVVVFALSLPFASFAGTGFAVLSAFERFKLLAVLQVTHKLVVFFVVAAALLSVGGTAAFVVGTAAGLALTGLVWLVVASVILSRATRDHWWTASWVSLQGLGRELRSLFGWNFVGVTFSGAMSQVPVLLLGGIRSPVEAGYFRLASTIAVTAGYPEAAMSRVAYPMLAAAQAEGDERRIGRLIVAWSRRESLLAALVVLVGMVSLPVVVLVGLGDNYLGMLAGAEMLLIGTAVSAAFFFVMPCLYSSGRVKTWVVAYGIYAFGAIAAGALLAELWGFTAFAAFVGIGLAVLNVALGVPILRRARWMTASQEVLVDVAAASAHAYDRTYSKRG